MRRFLTATVLGVSMLTLVAGCGGPPELVPLMPTPAIYSETDLDLLAEIPEAERWVPRRVYYATTRERLPELRHVSYGNDVGDKVSVGVALVGFGPAEMRWADLRAATRDAERTEALPLTLAGIAEIGRYTKGSTPSEAAEPEAAGWLLRDLNRGIAGSRSKDLLVYVHGAKVDFYNACAYAAQLDHYIGRRMTSIAFSWPTRQDILSYGLGGDVKRAYGAAPELATFLEMLAERTDAERIHVLCWSAGGRVTTAALAQLREKHADLGRDQLAEKLRIGTVYFAAADVPDGEFLDSLGAMHDLTDQLVVSSSDNDGALQNASRFMGGGNRIGTAVTREFTDEELAFLRSLDRFHVVNVSVGSESRGFNITGHRYWFDHPWASSDVLLSIATQRGPAERGLVQKSRMIWAIPPDYPDRLRAVYVDIDADLEAVRAEREAPAPAPASE